MRAESGIAIGKIVGIWYNMKSTVFEKSPVSAVKRAMSLKRDIIRTAINVQIDSENTRK